MEVHHPHHPAHKKKWGEYLLEFFMLFLAVFLGFVAENVRETIVERGRGKEYIESFVEDLQKDQQQLTRIIPLVKERKKRLDSLNYYMHNLDGHTAALYYYARYSTRPFSFAPSDRTIIQLKNSGGFRLITDRSSADSIMRYQAALERYQYALLRDEQEVEHLHPYLAKLFDAGVFNAMIDSENVIHKPIENVPMHSMDTSLINEFSYYVHQLITTTYVEIQVLQRIQTRAANTLEFLKNKYNLK
ncbi:MAG TPA: hypothetical protein VMY77_00645 [Chitinophagaceae bacterium]|nr:hypothetical protein [Chitinophagaceae bacterium]